MSFSAVRNMKYAIHPRSSRVSRTDRLLQFRALCEWGNAKPSTPSSAPDATHKRSPPSMKLGFYTYSYIDRLKMPIEPDLEQVAATGYDGIDISATWRDDLDPGLMPLPVRDLYARAAQRLGLEIEAVVTHLELVDSVWNHRPLNLKGAVDVACDVGAKIAAVHIGRADGHPERAWQTAVDYLRDACAYAAEKNVTIALDGVFKPSIIDTADKALALVKQVDCARFGINFDPCYEELSGLSWQQDLPVLLPYIVHAHIKDYTVHLPDFPQRIPEGGVFDAERWFSHRIPGEGVLDHHGYVALLHEAGFDRYLINECFIDAPFERACHQGYRVLAEAMMRCGARPCKDA